MRVLKARSTVLPLTPWIVPSAAFRLLLALGFVLATAADARAQSLAIDNVTQPEGDVGTSPMIFTVTLAPSSGLTVTVDYATANNLAQSPSDYLAASGTLTFLPGETTQTIPVDIVGDTASEGNETFFVNLTNPMNATFADSQGVGTINNDDVQMSIGDATVVEGDSGTTAMTFDVTLSAPKTGLTVSANWATQNNSAQAGSDYVADSGTVTFLPGETLQTISVDAIGDTVFEGAENFFVNLTNPVNCSFSDPQGLGTINNDDVQVSIGNATVTEGDAGTTALVFDVTLSAPKSGLTITVNWATQNNSAQAGTDYVADSGTVTFLPGETLQTVTVDAIGDTVWEGSENFFVNLTSPVNCSLGDPQGVGTITNDDAQVSIGNATVTEGDAGTVALVFNVTLSLPKNNLTVTVNWATANNSAQAGIDYVANSGIVTFLPGETLHTVSVDAIGDTVWEGAESFYVDLSGPVNCSLGTPRGVGTINNDDVQVSIGNVTMPEGNSGTTPFVFDVTLSGPKGGLTLSVDWATQNNSALAGSDYVAASGTVTFLPGETAQTVTVDVLTDLALETTETFYVKLSNPVNCSLGNPQGVGFIENDDVQGVLSIADLSLPEGHVGATPFAFTVSLSAPSASTVSVHFATADDTAVAGVDYTGGSGLLTFAAGETSKFVTVTVLGDATEECDETFFVDLSSPSGAPIGDGQAVGTIEDDENPTCVDLDGDCARDAACGSGDCDDSNPDTYPGAIEVNDAFDNQCPGDFGYGVADEISGTSGFLDAGDPTIFSWPAQAGALDYEVARAESRDFSTGCTVLGSTIDTMIIDPDVPGPGLAWFYLVRPLTPNVGSWGQRSSGVERILPCAP